MFPWAVCRKKASQSVRPFLQDSAVRPSQTTERAASVATNCIDSTQQKNFHWFSDAAASQVPAVHRISSAVLSRWLHYPRELATNAHGCSGAGTRGTASPPLFSTGGTRPPLPPLFGLKFVQKLVHCCNWLHTETQCKIISVQQN